MLRHFQFLVNSSKIESCFPGLALPELSGPSGLKTDDDRASHHVVALAPNHLARALIDFEIENFNSRLLQI